MGEKNYFKVICIIAFVLLAGVSCWATQESIHLSLPKWPQAICWIITIAFFIIASWGSKMIVDSMNQNVFVEKRGAKFVGGVLILLAFWLFFSMPTNTHTFFYLNSISDEASHDISRTKDYLIQISEDQITNEHVSEEIGKCRTELTGALQALEAEIFNPVRPGDGTEAEKIRAQIANILRVAIFPKLAGDNSGKVSQQVGRKLVDRYRQTAMEIFENVTIPDIKRGFSPLSESVRTDAKRTIDNLALREEALMNGTLDLMDSDAVQDMIFHLNHGYQIIRNNSQRVRFQGDEDHYCPKDEEGKSLTAVTRVTRMLSVIDVWKDFFKGKYAGRGMILWVLLAILADLGAFIFFDLAFKKDQYTV